MEGVMGMADSKPIELLRILTEIMEEEEESDDQ